MSSDCSRVVRRINTSAGNDFSPSETTNQIGMITEVLRNENEMMNAGWNADNSHCAPGRETFQNYQPSSHFLIRQGQSTNRTDGFYPGLVAGGIIILGLSILALSFGKKK
jgi:hypothetical protein